MHMIVRPSLIQRRNDSVHLLQFLNFIFAVFSVISCLHLSSLLVFFPFYIETQFDIIHKSFCSEPVVPPYKKETLVSTLHKKI